MILFEIFRLRYLPVLALAVSLCTCHPALAQKLNNPAVPGLDLSPNAIPATPESPSSVLTPTSPQTQAPLPASEDKNMNTDTEITPLAPVQASGETPGETAPNAMTPITPGQPPTGLNTPITDEVVTPFEEPGTASLLKTLLTASVTKTQEYPVDLPTVLQLVQTQNLPTAQDALTARIQRLTFYRSLSDLLPDPSFTYSQSRFQGTIQIFGNQTQTIYRTQYQPQAIANWTIFPGGQTLFEALAARRRSIGARLQSQETLQQQLTQAANDYYTLIEAYVQKQNAQLGIDEAQTNLRFNEARLRAGVGTKLDVARAQSQLAQQERVLIDAQVVMYRSEQALLARLNLDPEIHLTPASTAAQPHVLVPLNASSDKLLAVAVDRHPSLKRAKEEIKALEDEMKAIWGRLVPSVTLQTYIGGTGPGLDKLGLTRFGGLTIQANMFENLGLALPLDLRSKHFQIQRQKLIWQEQFRTVQTDVVNSFLDSRSFAEAILVSQEDLAASQEAYRLALGRYRAGLGIFLDVLNAEVALTDARTRMARSILGFNRAQDNLVQSLGLASQDSLVRGIDPGVLNLPSASTTPSPNAPVSSPAMPPATPPGASSTMAPNASPATAPSASPAGTPSP